MRAGIVRWGLRRWPGSVAIHEMPVGSCRIDIAFVSPTHIAGVEIKSSSDTLSRMSRQLAEYAACIPEVWVALAPKWWDAMLVPGFAARSGDIPHRVGRLNVSHSSVSERYPIGNGIMGGRSAIIDMTMTSPVLHLLTKAEMERICEIRSIPYRKSWVARRIMTLIARELTGDQVISDTCRAILKRI